MSAPDGKVGEDSWFGRKGVRVPGAVEQVRPDEREFLIWLRSVEKRAILPLKWAILATAVLFWILARPGDSLPPVDLFALFVVYFMFNLGESYLLWVSRVEIRQVRPLCFASYAMDVGFVTALVFIDAQNNTQYAGTAGVAYGPGSDFYVFYFLLILRSFALFPSPRQNVIANGIVGSIFVVSLIVLQDTTQPAFASPTNLIRIVFILMVILMSWFIVEILNRQKAEIMRAQENLIRSENMALLGQLAAGVAHEINNPIGIISVYAEYLKKSAPEGDERTEDFEAIRREAQRCKEIVAELLDYSRPATRERTPTDLRVLLDDVAEFVFRHTAGGTVTVHREYGEAVPLVPADANQLKQALLNILMNARQAMAGREGKVDLSLQYDPDRQGAVLRVGDNGGGVSPEDLKQVFSPYFTSRSGGTGLGLSITKRIVESHGGTIAIDSVQDMGTAVTLFLPAEPA